MAEYRELFTRLRRRGILVFAGLIFGLDADTDEYFRGLPAQLDAVGPEVLLMSLAIPIPGTPWHRQVAAAGRVLDSDLSHYEGDHLVFRPNLVTPDRLLEAYRANNRHFFRWPGILARWVRYLKCQKGFGLLPDSLVRTMVSTGIYFKLSVFQKHHARRRVFVAPAEEMSQ